MIDSLIDKQDTVEIVRDQIAALLALEAANQVALATAAGKPDPQLWALRVYQERTSPWELFPGRDDETTPVVNVWWDSETFDMSASNIAERQKAAAIINIDCYGYGESRDDGAGGHISGDQDAAEAVQRAVRLVRNMLMAAENTYLGLRGTVRRRWFDSITILRPQQDDPAASRLVGARMAFRVEFNEYSPQVEPETLELLTVEVRRTEDNQVVVAADYEYPLP